ESRPINIDSRNNVFTFTESFSKKMKHAGGVVNSNFIKNNTVISSDYCEEYSHFPETVFNVMAGKISTSDNHRNRSIGFHTSNIVVTIGSFFSTVYLSRFLRSDGQEFKKLIPKYLDAIDTDRGFIPTEYMDMIIYVLFENSCRKTFGPKLSNDKNFLEILNKLGNPYLNFAITHLNISLYLESLNNPQRFSTQDPQILTLGLYTTLKTMVSIPSSRIQNILTDISSNLNLQSILVMEQKDIILDFGSDLSLNVLKKMIYLDAFIKESLLLSAPAILTVKNHS
ncbi:hypothetical protein BB560_004232, partial [Smittium megazygosporum]